MTKTFRLALSSVLFVSLAGGLSGCLDNGSGDTPSEDAGGGTGGGGGGGGSLPACTTTGSASGFFASSNGIFQNATIGTTVNSVTMYFAGTSAGSQSLTVTAYECGFSGSSVATANATISNLSTTATYKPATFTFSSPITLNSNCGGSTGRIALKVTGSGANTSSQLYVGVIQAGNAACTMKLSSDVSSATPTQQATWEVLGALQ